MLAPRLDLLKRQSDNQKRYLQMPAKGDEPLPVRGHQQRPNRHLPRRQPRQHRRPGIPHRLHRESCRLQRRQGLLLTTAGYRPLHNNNKPHASQRQDHPGTPQQRGRTGDGEHLYQGDHRQQRQPVTPTCLIQDNQSALHHRFRREENVQTPRHSLRLIQGLKKFKFLRMSRPDALTRLRLASMVNTNGAQVLTPLTCQTRAQGSWRPQVTTGTICSGAGLAQGHGPGPLSEPPSL